MSHTPITRHSPAAAAAAAAGGDLVLVDVREPVERVAGRPEPSVHVPLGEMPEHVTELPRDRPVAFICRSGGRSSKAAELAAEHGIDAASVDGGMLAWKSAGLPSTSGPEPTAQPEDAA